MTQQHVLVSCSIANLEKIYLYEVDGTSFLIGSNRLELTAKYRFETLKIWSFFSDEFTLNFLTLKGKDCDVILEFGASQKLIEILSSRGVEVDKYHVLSKSRTEGLLKYHVFELEGGTKLHLKGGRYAQMQLVVDKDSEVIELHGYKDAVEKKPKFLDLKKVPKKIEEADVQDSDSVEALVSEYKKITKQNKVANAFGCLGVSAFWLVGTLVAVAIIFYIVSRVMG